MKLFFRNDDMGTDPDGFLTLLKIFENHNTKLNVAAIPISCEKVYKKGEFQNFSSILQIHTHGFSHTNYQPETVKKKCEYPSHRTIQDVRQEFSNGKTASEKLFGNLYFPAFTPPWNNMAEEFVPLLPEAGYKILSRKRDAYTGVAGLKEVNVDFDFRPRDIPVFTDASQAWAHVKFYIEHKETVGIMLHHAFFRKSDFDILNEFLGMLEKEKIQAHFFSEFVN